MVSDRIQQQVHSTTANSLWLTFERLKAPPLPAGDAPANRVSSPEHQPPCLDCLPPQYPADIEQFCSWWAQNGKSILDGKLTSQDVQQYLAWLASPVHELGRGRMGAYAPSTIARKQSALKCWFNQLIQLGRLTHNPAAGIKISLKAYKPTPRSSLSPATIDAIPATTPKGIRDRAILGLLAAGLSKAQVTRLNVGDLDSEAWAVTVRTRAGRRRQVFLSEQVITAVKRWSATRRLLHPPDPDAFFISLHWTAGRSEPRRRLGVDGVRRIVARYRRGSRAKNAKRLPPIATTGP